jgi:prolyl oligopeptidase
VKDLRLALALVCLVACGGTETVAPEPPDPPDPVVKELPAVDHTPIARDLKGAAEPWNKPYPRTRRENIAEKLHGVTVADPYRWLEDDNADETKAWVEAQNKVTFGYLDKLSKRDALKERLTKLWNYEKYGVPYKMGGRYFFTKNDGLQNQSVLYWTTNLKKEPKVLLDPNKLSEDGTVALAGYRISENGKYITYGLAKAGSDWNEWHVKEIKSGKKLKDHLKWIKFSGPTWSHDHKGFYYSRFPEPKPGQTLSAQNVNQKLYYHRLGDDQKDDELIYERPDHPKWGFGTQITEDGRYLVLYVSKGTDPKNLILYRDANPKKAKKRAKARRTAHSMAVKGFPRSHVGKYEFTTLVGEFEADYSLIGNNGKTFFFKTDKDAPRGRIVQATDSCDRKDLLCGLDSGSPNLQELVPQSKDTLRGVSLVGNRFFATYLSDAKSKIVTYSTKGKRLGEVTLPGIGTAYGFGGKRKHKETFFYFTGYTTPGSVYRYDVRKNKSTVFKETKVDFDPAGFETKQVFYKSKDGTKVPMFITHKKGLALDGNNPTYLYGYGGFNVSLTPRFSVSSLVWMENGGVLAVPNLRGGGEYGRAWHKAGTKLQKQNVFDDFIAAAEYLIANKYTTPAKLAINGGSNGGLLVGAVMTQRPDLFAAAVPKVGVLDMLRYHKFTIGWAWMDDYGNPETLDEFKALYAYSPYHNLKVGVRYPSTMITTADHDDRVVPAHSFKFAAALQYAHKGDNPVMIRIQTKAGHGAGKPTSMRIAEAADVWAFLLKELGED